jgi:hypothetical protein
MVLFSCYSAFSSSRWATHILMNHNVKKAWRKNSLFHLFVTFQRVLNSKRPTIVFFLVPRNLSQHMERQARTGGGDTVLAGGYKEMSSILAAWPIAPSYMSPNTGGGGELRGLSQWEQLYKGPQINFEDLTPYLKVPKREIFSLSFFALSEPIWVCDLGTEGKNRIFYQLTPDFDGFWFFAAYW